MINTATTSTRDKLKEAAQRLFADRGLDNVSVRDIVAAAGQRNSASLHYYFGSKDALVNELILDSVHRISEARNRALDHLKEKPEPLELIDVVRIMATPQLPRKSRGKGETAVRFMNMLQQQHRELLMETIRAQKVTSYHRCEELVFELLPHLNPRLVRERLVLLALYINATFSAREAALEKPRDPDSIWRSPTMVSNLIDTMVGILRQEPSIETLQSYTKEKSSEKNLLLPVK